MVDEPPDLEAPETQSVDEPQTLAALLTARSDALFNGRVVVVVGPLLGHVAMTDGAVTEVRLGAREGEDALMRMLLVDDARTTLEPGRAAGGMPASFGGVPLLLARAAQRRARLENEIESVGGLGRTWALSFHALGRLLDGLPDEINPVLRLIDGKRSIARVAAEAPLEPMLVVRVLQKLLAEGLLALPEEAPPDASDDAPIYTENRPLPRLGSGAEAAWFDDNELTDPSTPSTPSTPSIPSARASGRPRPVSSPPASAEPGPTSSPPSADVVAEVASGEIESYEALVAPVPTHALAPYQAPIPLSAASQAEIQRWLKPAKPTPKARCALPVLSWTFVRKTMPVLAALVAGGIFGVVARGCDVPSFFRAAPADVVPAPATDATPHD